MIYTDTYNIINAKNPIIMDGGMGQELLKQSKGTPSPLWSTQILLDNPELITKVHLDFIQAGCHIITLSNYTCTPERLTRDLDINLFDALQNEAIKAAQNARNHATNVHPIALAGCLPPLIASYHPETCPTFDDALKSYQRIANIQAPHVDLLLCETMSSIHEAHVAVTAAQVTNLPVWVSFKLDDARKDVLPSGELLSDAIKAIEKMNVQAVLLNCSKPETILHNMATLQTFSGLTGIYPNNFDNTTDLKVGGTVNDLTARTDLTLEKFTNFMQQSHTSGVSILGGCCEISPNYIQAVAQKFYA